MQPGDTILFHAAAGGVGLIACQWAKHLGATVIGTVGSEEKAELARANGCDHVIIYREEDFVARVGEITGGAACQVVYDGVGKDTFPASLDCLRPFGLFVSFGNASGPVDAFDLGVLAQKGSLYVTRPTLFTHIARRATLKQWRRTCSGGLVRRGENPRPPPRQAQRSGGRASGARGPADDRRDGDDAVITGSSDTVIP